MLLMTIERFIIVKDPLISLDFNIKPVISKYSILIFNYNIYTKE